jgi:Calcineurin-like phosphoesterase
MVGWFDPGQLFRTGFKSIISLFVGEQSDRSIIQALASRRHEYYDYTIHYTEGRRGPVPRRDCVRDEVWLDFISDTGDGWNSTYAIAYAAAQRSLTISGDPVAVELPRADVLVFGGDQVYPSPSREEYQRRLVAPYAAAFGDDSTSERPHVYAVPGNHDWYDGLSAFTRLFCSDIGERRFAGWWTRQRRSYFVLKLPHDWWLVASDGQLQSDLDVPQIEHFREIVGKHMKAGDKVILCLAAPVWIYAEKYRTAGRVFDETDLIFLREEVFARHAVDVKVYLAGDLHHYRRHEETAATAGAEDPVQKITSGRWRRVSSSNTRGRCVVARGRGHYRGVATASVCAQDRVPRHETIGSADVAEPEVFSPGIHDLALFRPLSTSSPAGWSAPRLATRYRVRRGRRSESHWTSSAQTQVSRSGSSPSSVAS